MQWTCVCGSANDSGRDECSRCRRSRYRGANAARLLGPPPPPGARLAATEDHTLPYVLIGFTLVVSCLLCPPLAVLIGAALLVTRVVVWQLRSLGAIPKQPRQ